LERQDRRLRNFDIDFAQLVAAQIAVTVEAQLQREQIALSAISSALSTVMPHEAAALTLYDEARNELRVAAFDFPDHEEKCTTGQVIPLEGNPIGEAFSARKTVVIDYGKIDDPRAACSGLVSGCASPLIFRNRVLGVLGIKSKREHAFSSEDAELF
jgi:putative methionine-R-sulfoxide reductase with GAF domain